MDARDVRCAPGVETMSNAESPAKKHIHEWECIAPAGVYFWSCKTCPATKPYPGPSSGKPITTWKERCEDEARYNR